MLKRESAPLPVASNDENGATIAAPATAAQRRARFFNSTNAFDLKLPPVPRAHFTAERDRAMDPAAPTGLVALDLSEALRTGFPATTPIVLARYAVIRAGEALETRLKASAELYYAIRGAGETENGGETVAWSEGDVFTLPGGDVTRHRASGHAVLWLVSNEPQLAFERLEPPAPGNAEAELAHFPAAEIERQLDQLHAGDFGDTAPGFAVVFASAGQAHRRNVMPSLTLAMNSLPPGGSQRPHVHNSVAVTLCIQGEGCWSSVDGVRGDWLADAVSITPPTAAHSHHNDGPRRAKFLIVQDGGLYYHCRTMGFEFRE